jgi:hypothetical protein
MNDQALETETVQASDVPLVPPEPAATAAPADPRVDLGSGMSAPLSEVLSMYDPRCRFCTRGVQHFHEAGEPKTRLCGCAVRHMVRKLRGETPSAPAARVERNVELERKRAEGKLKVLRDALAKNQAELAERIDGHDRGIVTAAAELEVARVNLMDGDQHLAGARSKLADMEAAVLAQRQHVTDLEGELDGLREMAGSKESELVALRSRSEQILASAGGIRHHIERLGARIALHVQRNAGVLAPTEEPELAE